MELLHVEKYTRDIFAVKFSEGNTYIVKIVFTHDLIEVLSASNCFCKG